MNLSDCLDSFFLFKIIFSQIDNIITNLSDFKTHILIYLSADGRYRNELCTAYHKF